MGLEGFDWRQSRTRTKPGLRFDSGQVHVARVEVSWGFWDRRRIQWYLFRMRCHALLYHKARHNAPYIERIHPRENS